jgi:hypothetical protein
MIIGNLLLMFFFKLKKCEGSSFCGEYQMPRNINNKKTPEIKKVVHLRST